MQVQREQSVDFPEALGVEWADVLFGGYERFDVEVLGSLGIDDRSNYGAVAQLYGEPGFQALDVEFTVLYERFRATRCAYSEWTGKRLHAVDVFDVVEDGGHQYGYCKLGEAKIRLVHEEEENWRAEHIVCEDLEAAMENLVDRMQKYVEAKGSPALA